MGHKADETFFKEKRHWSERKDEILKCYLTPYIAKVSRKKPPMIVIDAFAGPGYFEDGNQGSPVIIANVISDALSRNSQIQIRLLCIEKIKSLFDKLMNVVNKYQFAEAYQGTFEYYLPEIAEYAKRNTIFLYVDPFTVEGLNWNEMDRVFEHVDKSKMSIEILLNFNAATFVRRALSALALNVPECDPSVEDFEEIDIPIESPPTIGKLNEILGGDWWQQILKDKFTFPEQVERLTQELCKKLSTRFNEVCYHGIKALPHHTVPKYYLIFASPHPDALVLMNDQMVKSQRTLADLAKPIEPTLFETRSLDLVPDPEVLPQLILKYTKKPLARKEVIVAVIREVFCKYSYSEIRGSIESMLKRGLLQSETGKNRINDEVKIWSVRI